MSSGTEHKLGVALLWRWQAAAQPFPKKSWFLHAPDMPQQIAQPTGHTYACTHYYVVCCTIPACWICCIQRILASPLNAAVDRRAGLPLPSAHWAGTSRDRSDPITTITTPLAAAITAAGGGTTYTRCGGGVEGEAVPVGGPLGHKGLKAGGATGSPPEGQQQQQQQQGGSFQHQGLAISTQ
jgi:hypothetical protein